ncbi:MULTISPECIES: hypothetical protein [unclassified Actinoplanes]|uniref:hypothetical protein n=1 Tax=unclassified Actinoplanes TaxID=2626549 RepID=UPI000316A681|nr:MULTISPECIES: hypothetical protein [unclassified Actinoplanes]
MIIGRGRFAVAAVVAIVAYQFLPAVGWLTVCWQVAIGWASAAVIVAGARRQTCRDRAPWWCFAAGVFSNATGILVAKVSAVWWNLADLPTRSSSGCIRHARPGSPC